jgi:hypothetical protein
MKRKHLVKQFRLVGIQQNTYYYDDFVVYPDGEVEFPEGGWDLQGYFVDRNNYILQQFTGMYDVDKNPIYEGDIIQRHYEYPEEEPVIINNMCDIYKYELDSSKCLVIGNIHIKE